MWFDPEDIEPGWTWVDSAYLSAIIALAGVVLYLTLTWRAGP